MVLIDIALAGDNAIVVGALAPFIMMGVMMPSLARKSSTVSRGIGLENIVGHDHRMQRVFDMVDRIENDTARSTARHAVGGDEEDPVVPTRA